MISITWQSCETRQHPEPPAGYHRLERRAVLVAGEMERLEAGTDGPLAQLLQGGVQYDRLAGLFGRGFFGACGDHFDGLTETPGEEEEKEEEEEQIRTS